MWSSVKENPPSFDLTEETNGNIFNISNLVAQWIKGKSVVIYFMLIHKSVWDVFMVVPAAWGPEFTRLFLNQLLFSKTLQWALLGQQNMSYMSFPSQILSETWLESHTLYSSKLWGLQSVCPHSYNQGKPSRLSSCAPPPQASTTNIPGDELQMPILWIRWRPKLHPALATVYKRV